MGLGMANADGFNTQPPEGGWLWQMSLCAALPLFQHTAARRRLALRGRHNKRKQGFNTQPPEGGWHSLAVLFAAKCGFNTQPPEGGWGGNTA